MWSSLLVTRTLALWLPVAAAVTGLALLIYAAVQQDLRLGADDSPVELARTTADRLDAGDVPATIVPNRQVDLSRATGAFVLIFDADGHLIASGASLHGLAVDYPTGVFDTVRTTGENRVTWQPEPGVRSATVAVRWHGGYVVAGHSLLLTEQHIDLLGKLIAAGWLGTLALVAVAALVATLISPTRELSAPVR